MRYRKGSKVEVLNRTDLPSGSWRRAEIISGNGHSYGVRYDCYSPDTVVTVERVPRKAIRPRPPPVDGPRSWALRDIVEVFDNNSWKPAQVSREAGGSCFFVRLLGSSREVRAHASNLRVRQTWQDDRWVVIRKEPGKCDDGIIDRESKIGKCILRMPQSCLEVKKCGGVDRFRDVINDGFEEHCQVSSRSTKKRPHFCLPLVGTCDGASRKMTAVEKEGRRQRMIAGHPSHLLKKVDAVASPRTMLGEKYVHASIGHKATRFCEPDLDRGKLNAEPNDAESTCSSVGSCSSSNSPHISLYDPITSPSQDSDSHIDETEFSSKLEREPSLPTIEGPEEEIHRLELYAYRSTMLAFHAFGPLTWEKEALLTNLRLMLHISNDEHLLELKHLASAKTDIRHSLKEAIPSSL